MDQGAFVTTAQLARLRSTDGTNAETRSEPIDQRSPKAMGVVIAGVSMFALLSGGVLTLGLIPPVTGRAPFNMWGEAWTRAEDFGASVGRS
jgi:hypothetical protein